MELHERVLQAILEQPGTQKKNLSGMFDLSDYRLNRVLRIIERGLSGRTVVQDKINGVWIVETDPERCGGMVWIECGERGYRQCEAVPAFRDGCCYVHSQCENPEIVAFRRKLEYLVGPVEPTAYYVSQLTMTEVEQLSARLNLITPLTRRDELAKSRFVKMIASALLLRKWKDEMRRSEDEDRIPPEFFSRHRRSSVNIFEYSLKKHFVVLEVPVEASREEVLSAWRKLARKYHPDLLNGDEDRMKAINLAKEKIFRLKRWD
ncbi:MAG TPA: DnaJ domain-containing protein [Desulfomonilaceae bacterium]|nr:DnaJ domain-containing protein [Desulfomonilaceae bacterium]